MNVTVNGYHFTRPGQRNVARALRAFCDGGYEHSSLAARAITERALEVVKNKDKENDELYEQLHTQVKRFATIASVVKL